MKRQKPKLLTIFFIIAGICISALMLPIQVQAATSGAIPCSEGTVTWTLDDNGVLTFHGSGTTNITTNPLYDTRSYWTPYWNGSGLDKKAVTAVKMDRDCRIKVNICRQMFSDFENCVSMDLSGFDTSMVTDMSSMFIKCKSLETVDISHFDTSNVEDMDSMFHYCSALKKMDLSKLDTGKVTKMRSMFSGCSSLVEVNLGQIDTKKVTDTNHMFYTCSSLQELDLSHFTGQPGEYMISGCHSLNKLITPNQHFEFELTQGTGKVWIDNEGNVYYEEGVYRFPLTLDKTTVLQKVNEIYPIHYMADGELINCPQTYSVKDGLAELGSMEHPHGTFGGWYKDAAYTEQVTSIKKGTYGDITLYGKWIPNTYQITYVNIDNILNKESLLSEYIYGSSFLLPQPEKTCYEFKGWFLEEACTNKISSITNTTEGNLVLYAKWEEKHDVDKTHGTILKQPTETETGLIQYQCRNCTYTITEEMPKLPEEDTLNQKKEGDLKNSSFAKIQARADKTTKNSIRLRWNKVKGADGYLIYGNKCNIKNKYLPITTINNPARTTYTLKKLETGTYYKYIVKAYKLVKGKKQDIAVSKTIHATTNGGKYGNAKAVKVNKSKVTLKKNKKFTLKASEVKKDKTIDIHRRIAFESSNEKIATVSKKGVITAKKTGTCYIYAYAQNGTYQKIKVTVQ